MSTTFNPMSVMMGKPSNPLQPYISRSPVDGPKNPLRPGQEGSAPGNLIPPHGTKPTNPLLPGQERSGPAQPSAPSTTLGPESVRATGTGPFDDTYRQNLATFAGGLFGRPGGMLGFNPTSNQPFGGAQVGGGNAPLFGMPSTQNQMALGGNPFSFTPPVAQQQNASPGIMTMSDWLKQFTSQGRNLKANFT